MPRKRQYSKVPTSQEWDPCKILKARAGEEIVAQTTYQAHATQKQIFNDRERAMFAEQAGEEGHHLAENEDAQKRRGCK